MNGALNQLCVHCGHPDHWHSHSDEDCASTHQQPCVPETAPFRCLGYDCDGPAYALGTPDSRCGCRAFQPGETPAPCLNCGGMGTTMHDILFDGTEHDTEERDCDVCKGTGLAGETPALEGT